jgi:hypothetical protein
MKPTIAKPCPRPRPRSRGQCKVGFLASCSSHATVVALSLYLRILFQRGAGQNLDPFTDVTRTRLEHFARIRQIPRPLRHRCVLIAAGQVRKHVLLNARRRLC